MVIRRVGFILGIAVPAVDIGVTAIGQNKGNAAGRKIIRTGDLEWKPGYFSEKVESISAESKSGGRNFGRVRDAVLNFCSAVARTSHMKSGATAGAWNFGLCATRSREPRQARKGATVPGTPRLPQITRGSSHREEKFPLKILSL